MHPLMLAILLRRRRLGPLVLDPQPPPPDAQAGQPPQPAARERRAVVRADHLRQTVLAKRQREALDHRVEVDPFEPVAGDDLAAEAVGDRQRITILPIAEPELALEIRAPQLVRRHRTDQPIRIARNPVAALAWFDQVRSLEQRPDRAGRGPAHLRRLLLQHRLELAPAQLGCAFLAAISLAAIASATLTFELFGARDRSADPLAPSSS